MTEQTKAQRLADKLSDIPFIGFFAHGQLGTEDSGVCKEAAAELRRLDALNAELVEALEKLARLGNGDSYGNSIGNDIAIAALAKAKGESNA